MDKGDSADLPEVLTTLQQSLAHDGQVEFGRLLPTVYEELRALAGSYFANQPANHTLQPTALVHEVYAKLAGASPDEYEREHFLALAATVMRQVLADHAKGKSRQKRGSDWRKVTLSAEPAASAENTAIDLVDLDRVLTDLASLDERQARIVELRFLAGLTIEETAKVLGVSRRTVELEWRGARAWLRRALDAAVEP